MANSSASASESVDSCWHGFFTELLRITGNIRRLEVEDKEPQLDRRLEDHKLLLTPPEPGSASSERCNVAYSETSDPLTREGRKMVDLVIHSS